MVQNSPMISKAMWIFFCISMIGCTPLGDESYTDKPSHDMGFDSGISNPPNDMSFHAGSCQENQWSNIKDECKNCPAYVLCDNLVVDQYGYLRLSFFNSLNKMGLSYYGNNMSLKKANIQGVIREDVDTIKTFALEAEFYSGTMFYFDFSDYPIERGQTMSITDVIIEDECGDLEAFKIDGYINDEYESKMYCRGKQP